MKKEKYKFVVVGGGTAGAIVSSYIKTYWEEYVEVILVYNSKEPNIGVGESLTPNILSYLNYVNISVQDLITQANSTIKLGIKFKNWLNDGSYFYHPFNSMSTDNGLGEYNFEAAYDYVNGNYDHDTTYGSDMLDNHRIPDLNTSSFSFHIDGVLFSKIILEKFKDKLTIIDDIVIDVVKKNNSEFIDYLVCEKNNKIEGDFYIDASGFNNILFKKLENTWIDKQDWLPLNKFIPNPVFTEHKFLPVCTTAEATDQGWILQVPLSHRWGTGYLFSSNFISDQDALDKFDLFLNQNFNSSLSNGKVLSFKSGYWENQWVGNCICVGLSSGFTEPLEATNIHQTVSQIRNFVNRFNFEIFQFDIDQYNEYMRLFYERVYLFIRYCYTTGRTDSEFWTYLTNNVPYEVKCLDEKLKKDFLNFQSMSNSIFNYNNFFKISYGLKKIDLNSYRTILEKRQVVDKSKYNSDLIRDFKNKIYQQSFDHLEYIKFVKNNYS